MQQLCGTTHIVAVGRQMVNLLWQNGEVKPHVQENSPTDNAPLWKKPLLSKSKLGKSSCVSGNMQLQQNALCWVRF